MQADDAADELANFNLHAPPDDGERHVAGSFPDTAIFGSKIVATRVPRCISWPCFAGSIQTRPYTSSLVLQPGRSRLIRNYDRDNEARVHREVLSRTELHTYIFADNRGAARVRNRFGQFGIPEAEDGFRLEIPIPYLEPVAYFAWLYPLNRTAWILMKGLPIFQDQWDIVENLLWLSATAVAISASLTPAPAYLYMQTLNRYSVSGFFYNLHASGVEGVLVATAVLRFQRKLGFSQEVQYFSFLTSFFVTLICRQDRRRHQRVTDVTFSVRNFFTLVIVA